MDTDAQLGAPAANHGRGLPERRAASPSRWWCRRRYRESERMNEKQDEIVRFLVANMTSPGAENSLRFDTVHARGAAVRHTAARAAGRGRRPIIGAGGSIRTNCPCRPSRRCRMTLGLQSRLTDRATMRRSLRALFDDPVPTQEEVLGRPLHRPRRAACHGRPSPVLMPMQGLARESARGRTPFWSAMRGALTRASAPLDVGRRGLTRSGHDPLRLDHGVLHVRRGRRDRPGGRGARAAGRAGARAAGAEAATPAYLQCPDAAARAGCRAISRCRRWPAARCA